MKWRYVISSPYGFELCGCIVCYRKPLPAKCEEKNMTLSYTKQFTNTIYRYKTTKATRLQGSFMRRANKKLPQACYPKTRVFYV